METRSGAYYDHKKRCWLFSARTGDMVLITKIPGKLLPTQKAEADALAATTPARGLI